MNDIYKKYFEAMPCYLTVQDKSLRLIDANEKFRKEFGDVDGRHCYQIYKNRSEKCEVCPVERTFSDGESHHSQEKVKNLEGREVWVIVYTTPIKDDQGNVTAVMEMSTDITENKILENQLRESQEKYHLLFEEVPCFISIQDKDLRIVEANRMHRELLVPPMVANVLKYTNIAKLNANHVLFNKLFWMAKFIPRKKSSLRRIKGE